MPPPAPSRTRVDIHYRRLPDDVQVFTQELLLDREDVKVTLARDVTFDSPVVIHDRIALETGSDAVWFTFPGKWHDIGRFHRKDDTFTGIYANILTPPVFVDPGGAPRKENQVWKTTDLFLDIWLPTDGGLFVLDREQLAEAERQGWVDRTDAERARREAETIDAEHEAGRWPPPVVEEWTLERAREKAGG